MVGSGLSPLLLQMTSLWCCSEQTLQEYGPRENNCTVLMYGGILGEPFLAWSRMALLCVKLKLQGRTHLSLCSVVPWR